MELGYTIHPTSGHIDDIFIVGDTTHFRWTRGAFGLPDGLNYLAENERIGDKDILKYEYNNDLVLTVERSVVDGKILERYTLTNESDKAIKIEEGYYISIVFADSLDIPEVALKRRAYMRYYHGGNTFCVYNARMNGEKSGVSLVLTDGIIYKANIERRSKRSDSIIRCYFERTELAPKESTYFAWKIFGYSNRDEFITTVRKHMPFPVFEHYPVIVGEKVKLDLNGELYIDGKLCTDREVSFTKPSHIKAVNGDKVFETMIFSSSKNNYTYYPDELMPKNLHDDRAYKKLFTREKILWVPFDQSRIEKNEKLKKAYLKYRNCYFSPRKIFDPILLGAVIDYLNNCQLLDNDIRVSAMLEQLRSLYSVYCNSVMMFACMNSTAPSNIILSEG